MYYFKLFLLGCPENNQDFYALALNVINQSKECQNLLIFANTKTNFKEFEALN